MRLYYIMIIIYIYRYIGIYSSWYDIYVYSTYIYIYAYMYTHYTLHVIFMPTCLYTCFEDSLENPPRICRQVLAYFRELSGTAVTPCC